MIKHATECKFCKAKLVIEIDEDYASVGDYLNLMPLAACNRCADLRVRKRTIEEAIYLTVGWLNQNPRAPKDATRQTLTELTQAYARLIADWLRASGPAWDAEIVELILDKPKHAARVLFQCWKMYEPSRGVRNLLGSR